MAFTVMLKTTPAVGLAEDAFIENLVATGGGGALLPLPHAMRKHKPQIMIESPTGSFMTPPQANFFAQTVVGAAILIWITRFANQSALWAAY